ncbi:hypothetical protein LTR78_005569 [Recurvomyces mirabilis]|uniref:Asl1-like glycosyl hydrolase catalytic domain-containing protein n=1 Tax=Recurvomyces mirabilis TaxID=574656 RepID=A0AAE0WME1_9PEZI|nr:hypothetical protein LTR78_005569 [Recurvomyces mirabilis]KAK5151312.1 hypothetical protein LTS14_009482 [Recurvomyces mirabilis]
MSPVTQFSVLAFAAGAFAVHGHHGIHSHPSRSGSASGSGMLFPYPEANATGLWGTTGTGLSTGTAAPDSASATSGGPPTVYVSPVPAASSSSSSLATYYNAASDSTTTCTTDVTITTTERTYVTVTAGDGSSSSSSVAVSATDLSTNNGQVTSHVTVHSTIYASASGPIVSSNSSSASYSASAPVYSAASVSSASSSSASSSSSSSSSIADANSQSQAQKYPTWHRSSSSADATSSSVYVAPSSSSVYVTPSLYSAPSSSSVYVAPTTSSVYVAPTTSSTSVYVAPTTSSSSAWIAPSSASSSASAPSYSSAPSTGGKRGLAYNDVSLTSAFGGSAHVGWGYNWGSSSGGLSSSLNYIPLLWGTRSDFTSVWAANAQAAINAGSTHLMSFNEPDLSTQANMSPQDAATAWKQYMEPFAGKAKLCAPAVTNGGGEMGLTWLSNFLSACQGCTIDCVSIHWYASHTLGDYFKEQVTNATTVSGGKPVFVSEFATTDGSNDDISSFLQDVMPWMDSNNDVAGYAYFMVSNGMLVSGSSPSSYGSTYATYSS